MTVNGKRSDRLDSFDEIVEALGGVKKTAELIKRSPAQICHWRKRYGKFPAEHYITISDGLLTQGYGAPLKLFTFERPAR